MTTTEATKLLLQNGIKVLKQSKNCYSVSYLNGQPWENRKGATSWATNSLENEWTGREIVKLARAYTDSNQQTTIRKSVKKFSNDKDRSATRDLLQIGDYDQLPPKNRVKSADIWDFD